jgi:hypothetical protein
MIRIEPTPLEVFLLHYGIKEENIANEIEKYYIDYKPQR